MRGILQISIMRQIDHLLVKKACGILAIPIKLCAVTLVLLDSEESLSSQHSLVRLCRDTGQLSAVCHEHVFHIQLPHELAEFCKDRFVKKLGSGPAVDRTDGDEVADAACNIPRKVLLHAFRILVYVDHISRSRDHTVLGFLNDSVYACFCLTAPPRKTESCIFTERIAIKKHSVKPFLSEEPFTLARKRVGFGGKCDAEIGAFGAYQNARFSTDGCCMRYCEDGKLCRRLLDHSHLVNGVWERIMIVGNKLVGQDVMCGKGA